MESSFNFTVENCDTQKIFNFVDCTQDNFYEKKGRKGKKHSDLAHHIPTPKSNPLNTSTPKNGYKFYVSKEKPEDMKKLSSLQDKFPKEKKDIPHVQTTQVPELEKMKISYLLNQD